MLQLVIGPPPQVEHGGHRRRHSAAPITSPTIALSRMSLKMRVLIEGAKVLAAVALQGLTRLPWWPSPWRRHCPPSLPRTRRR